MKLAVLVESYSLEPYAREGRSGVLAKVRGRTPAGAAAPQALLWDDQAREFDRAVSGMLPPGVAVPDLRLVCEFKGEEREAAGGRGTFFRVERGGVEILSGAALELARRRAEAASLHERVSALLAAEDPRAAAELARGFLASFSGAPAHARPRDQALDAAAPRTAAAPPPRSIEATPPPPAADAPAPGAARGETAGPIRRRNRGSMLHAVPLDPRAEEAAPEAPPAPAGGVERRPGPATRPSIFGRGGPLQARARPAGDGPAAGAEPESASPAP